MPGNVVFLLVVRLQLAEQLHGRFEFIRPELLIAHDENVAIDEGAVQGCTDFRIDRPPEIETCHFGAGVFG